MKDAIGRFAGEACFSNVLRLNYFRGDDDKVAFLASQGITALLCADDDRASYNLPETQNLLLQKNDYIVYQDMKYFKTDLRLDRIRFITYELLQLRDQETVVIFAHEWALVDIGFDRIESAVRWLVRNGYAFSYLED